MFRYALLGLVQGLTEFLPISSSGHLVLAQKLLGVASPGVALEAAAHLGTLLAVLAYFRGDLRTLATRSLRRGREERRYLGLLVLGTVPIAVVGVAARGVVERAFSAPALVGWMLIATAALLAGAGWWGQRTRREQPRAGDAIVVGLAQAAAILPGLSRSGATVAAGLGTGLTPREAVRFSFLLSIPAIAGGGAFALVTTPGLAAMNWGGLAVGAATAFAGGLAAIRFFLAAVRSLRLWPFALYCVAVGVVAILVG
ncbi:undecaprenyl-diphosphate phosphatase [Candidatus Bipolaricaulota bacterium]|nr:undecaprenyl-diphosphate phosphatase [Candidatus Bipolaricaulota bacterium]